MSADPNTQTASPPAGMTKAEVSAAIADAFKGFSQTLAQEIGSKIVEVQKASADAVAAARKDFTDALAKIPQGVKADDVAKVVTEQLAQRETTAAATKTRGEYIAANLKGVPPIYTDKLGSDPAKFENEAKAIRETYRKDLADAGVKDQAIGSGSAGGGTAPTGANIDTSKLSGAQLIELGVKQTAANPIAAPHAGPSALAGAAQAAIQAAVQGGAQNAALASAAGGASS